MNYYYSYFLFFLIGYTTYAQQVNNVPLQELPAVYIQVSEYPDLSSKTALHIDYGQRIDFFKTKQQALLKDERNEVMRFNSMIEGLNFLYTKGFVLYSTYTITKEGDENPFFILKNENYPEKKEG